MGVGVVKMSEREDAEPLHAEAKHGAAALAEVGAGGAGESESGAGGEEPMSVTGVNAAPSTGLVKKDTKKSRIEPGLEAAVGCPAEGNVREGGGRADAAGLSPLPPSRGPSTMSVLPATML